MLTRLYSANPGGLHQEPIEVEVDVRRGLPKFEIIGCVENATKEGKSRILSALKNSSYELNEQKITVNLAPSGLPKLGAGFDLPIALGILTSSGIIKDHTTLKNTFLFGEVGLNGRIKNVPQTFCYFSIAKAFRFSQIICSRESLEFAHPLGDMPVTAAATLGELVDHLNGQKPIQLPPADLPGTLTPAYNTSALDFSVIRGQDEAIRALTIAAAGGHHILLIGPPGVGKTLLSRCFQGILPNLTDQQAYETQHLYSLANIERPPTLFTLPPYRSPHHSISYAGLVGGGSREVLPGEVSLAHNGILFLDELGEFRRDALEALREPLETGTVSISRARHRISFPSRFQLLASSNPCPCGYWGIRGRQCHCSAFQLLKFRSKFSGPLFDRIDMHIPLRSVGVDEIEGPRSKAPTTPELRDIIAHARQIQNDRLKKWGLFENSQIHETIFHDVCIAHDKAKTLLKKTIEHHQLSVRSYFRIFKVARTIADMDESDIIHTHHMEESIRYKTQNENFAL